jgi:SAM-dependent methyltransferase
MDSVAMNSNLKQVMWGDVDWAVIRRITVVPFGDDVAGWVLPLIGGRPTLPSGAIRPGQEPGSALLDLLLMTAGYRLQEWYPFAAGGDHVVVWSRGRKYGGNRPHTDIAWWSGPAEEGVETLITQGDVEWGALLHLADERRRDQSDDEFYASRAWVLEPLYLLGTTPQEGSGFRGSDQDWYDTRSILCDAIPGDGSVLDVGCANGHLMECLATWCAERGMNIEPYGVDISERLVAEARRRLPEWARRIWVGNAIDWVPPEGQRFDVVHILLDCVPLHARGALVEHHLDRVVADGGRLLVSHYLDRPATILTELGFQISGETRAGIRSDGRVEPPSAWIEKTEV